MESKAFAAEPVSHVPMCSQGTVVISVARIPVVAGSMVAGMAAMTTIHTQMPPPHWGSFALACRQGFRAIMLHCSFFHVFLFIAKSLLDSSVPNFSTIIQCHPTSSNTMSSRLFCSNQPSVVQYALKNHNPGWGSAHLR